jgi:hypothetical protein
MAFGDCYLVDPISLPSSVEFMEWDGFNWRGDDFPFTLNGHHLVIRDNCLMRTNGRELIRYLGRSETFCVSREITVLGGESFRNSCATTLNVVLESLESFRNFSVNANA